MLYLDRKIQTPRFICRWLATSSLCALGWGVLPACGTDVKVGRNDDPQLVNQSKDDLLYEDGDSSAAKDPTNGQALSCFGAVTTLPDQLTDFCAKTSSDFQSQFSKAYDLICKEKQLANLFQDDCSYQGKNELTKYMRVLHRTDLEQANQTDFEFSAAYSLTIAKPMDRYLELLVAGYADPDFTKTYRTIKNSRLSDVVADANAGTVEYTVELATSAAVVKFRGRIDIVHYDSGLVAVFDQAVKDKTLVRENKLVILAWPLTDGRTRLVAIDDKIVDDGGNHRLAYSTAVNLDKERMEVAYENSLVP